MNDWIEVCEGLHRHTPPEMLKISGLPQWKTAHESSTAGLFASVFSYPTTDPQIGPVLSPLYLDFDCMDAPNKAQKEATAAIKKLMQDCDISESNVAIAFSGQKGFSVTISPEIFGAEASEHLPQIWKSIVKELAATLKLKHIDTVVYDRGGYGDS